MSQTIEELAQKRKRWIDANRENNFEDGIKRLLTELYPDNAHFIYELLQNAEDTGADVVRFILSEKNIEFEHNGARLFDLNDIDSITSIGQSTKRDDPTNIGKFGVGFKAVFAYTNTPEVHSGKFHFHIKDLVVPETNGVEQMALTDKETRFLFPFNHPHKRPSQAVEEIQQGLQNLRDNTLLFLNHISLIEYLLPDESLGYLKRIDHQNNHIEIKSILAGSEEASSHWLRYQKDVDVVDEEGESRTCRIAIAYSLERAEPTKKDQSEWKIVPLDYGQVSIYFPAEKETSNLRFHIHAPFASTVARDSVRECEANRHLRDCVAELLVESVIDIRDRGMLTMDFLAVLPNAKDNLSQFYRPILQRIVSAFEELDLTPTKSGGHMKSGELYRGPADISAVINDDDLAFLTGLQPPLWAANAPQRNQREDCFLESLDIDEWGWSELEEPFYMMDEGRQSLFEKWITEKPDSWLKRFYALLGQAIREYEQEFSFCDMRIIRVEKSGENKHVEPRKAFFAPDQELKSLDNVNFVKPSVYQKGRSEKQNKDAASFLTEIGVQSFDLLAICKLKLNEYEKGVQATSKKQHLKDVKMFVELWSVNNCHRNLFKNIAFLYGVNKTGKKTLSAVADLYMDQPYGDTHLNELFACSSSLVSKPKSKLSDEYLKIKNFAEFAKAIGVMCQLEICDYYATEMQGKFFEKTHNKTETTIDKDYYVNGLRWYRKGSNGYVGLLEIDEFCKLDNFSLSRAIWYLMCSADPKTFEAVYMPNRSNSHLIKSKSSFLIDYLKEKPWVPDKNRTFHKPEDVDRDSLHDDFLFNDQNGWLTAVGFGKGIAERKEALQMEKERQTTEYKLKEEVAKDLGFNSPEDAAEIAKLKNENPDAFEEFKNKIESQRQQPVDFPDKPVANPERRQEKTEERLSGAPNKKFEKRSRSVRTTANAIDPITWLRNQYTNDAGQMICQICKREMPFKKRDGTHYFEKKEMLSRKFLPKEDEANFLALCPVCAAKYKEFVNDDVMGDLWEAVVSADSCEIPISLGDENTGIRFVETHLCDLKTIIECES